MNKDSFHDIVESKYSQSFWMRDDEHGYLVTVTPMGVNRTLVNRVIVMRFGKQIDFTSFAIGPDDDLSTENIVDRLLDESMFQEFMGA